MPQLPPDAPQPQAPPPAAPAASAAQPQAAAPAAALPRYALAALALYFAAWALLPAWLAGSYPLDVVEGIYWGREWQWGYYKHPPLSSWVLYGFYRLFGAVGPYLLSQLVVALTLWLVYQLGRRILAPAQAALGSVLTLGVFYYTLPSLEFNHNIAQMPVWAGLALAFYLALSGQRLRHWLLLGLLAGLGLLVKYPVAIWLAAAAAFVLANPARRCLRQPGPWLTLALAALVFAPNLLWLAQHDWISITYARGRAAQAGGNPRWSALGFVATQLLCHLPLLALALAARMRPAWPWRAAADGAGLNMGPGADRGAATGLGTDTGAAGGGAARRQGLVFLWFMALAPAVLLVLASLVLGLGLRDMWGVPMWSLSGLLLASLLPQGAFERLRPRLLKGLLVWLALATVLMAAYVGWGGRLRGKPARTDWPQAALAAQAQAQWRQLSRCPLDNISGDDWLAGLAAVAMPGQPSVMLGSNAAYSPWMSVQRLRQHGSLMLWAEGQTPSAPLLAQIDAAPQGMHTRQGQWQLPWHKLPAREPLVVHWRAYVPPACLAAGSSAAGGVGTEAASGMPSQAAPVAQP